MRNISSEQLLAEVEGSCVTMNEVAKYYKMTRVTDVIAKNSQFLASILNIQAVLRNAVALQQRSTQYFQNASWPDLFSELFTDQLEGGAHIIQFAPDEEARIIERICAVRQAAMITLAGLTELLQETVQVSQRDLTVEPTASDLAALLYNAIDCQSQYLLEAGRTIEDYRTNFSEKLTFVKVSLAETLNIPSLVRKFCV